MITKNVSNKMLVIFTAYSLSTNSRKICLSNYYKLPTYSDSVNTIWHQRISFIKFKKSK